MALYNREMERFDPKVSDSLASFTSESGPINGVWTIDMGGVPLDFQVEDRGSPATVVFLSAALPAGPRRLPTFIGSGISEALPLNCIRISDPSLALSNSLGIAWYAGFDGVDLPAVLVEVIRHVQARLGAQHLSLFGASAGGFASLSLGQLLGPALSIAVNPQTVIERYAEEAWFAYMRDCWLFTIEGVVRVWSGAAGRTGVRVEVFR